MEGIHVAEYLAENELIEVYPNQSIKKLEFLTGTFGPFRPLVKSKVPLWLAISLKKKNKCRIIPPEWCSVDTLSRALNEEKEQDSFSTLPFHYTEIAFMLLHDALDDLENANEIRNLIHDIRLQRERKIRAGLKHLDGQYLQMNGIGMMEIEFIRPMFTKAFKVLRDLS